MRTMRFRPSAVLLALASVLVLASVGCDPSGGGGTASPTIDARRAAVNATSAPLLPTNVLALPEFTVERYEMLLGQLRGTPVVVNMWGSWCPPCRDEAPMLAEAHHEFGDRIQFLGIDIEDDRAGAITFIREFGWRFPSVVDPADPSRFKSELGFLGQPNTLFYDASGELVRTWQGPLTAEVLRNGIARIDPDG